MAEFDSPRVGVHRWTADTDSLSRAEVDATFANIESRVVVFAEGTRAARPAPGVGGRVYTVKGDPVAALNGAQFYDNGTSWTAVGAVVEDVVARGSSAAAVPLVAKGAAGASGNLQEWRDSTDGVKASMSPAGKLTAAALQVTGATTMGSLTVTGELNAPGLTSSTLTTTGAITPASIVSSAKRADGEPKFRMLSDGSFNGDGLIPPGTVAMTFASTAPAGWLFLIGQTLSRSTYPDLFAAVQNVAGVVFDASTFTLPNWRDRSPFGASAARPVGTTGGAETRTLTVDQLPSHTHSINHTHASVVSTLSGTHQHDALWVANDGGDVGTYRSGSIAGRANDNGALINVAGEHAHTVQVPAFAGTSGPAGAAANVDVMGPWAAVNFMVKV